MNHEPINWDLRQGEKIELTVSRNGPRAEVMGWFVRFKDDALILSRTLVHTETEVVYTELLEFPLEKILSCKKVKVG